MELLLVVLNTKYYLFTESSLGFNDKRNLVCKYIYKKKKALN